MCPFSFPYLLPFVQLLADVTSLVEVGETFRDGQEPKEQRREKKKKKKTECRSMLKFCKHDEKNLKIKKKKKF